MDILIREDGTGGIEELASRGEPAGCLPKHGELQRRELGHDIFFRETPRDFGMSTHRPRTGTWGVDEHRIECQPLPCPRIVGCQRSIEICGVAGNHANARDTSRGQTLEVLVAFTLMKVERIMFAVESGTASLAHHDKGFGPTAGADFETGAGTCRRRGDKLRIQVRRDRGRAVENTRSDSRRRTDGRIAAGKQRLDQRLDIRIGSKGICIYMKRKRGGGEVADKGKTVPAIAVERCDQPQAQPTGNTEHARKPHESALGFIGIGRFREITDMLGDPVEHGIRKSSRGLRTGTHKLDALTDGHAGLGMQIEYLERRDAKRHPHPRGNLVGLVEKSVEQLIEHALGRSNAQGETRCKGGVAGIERLGMGAGGKNIPRVHPATIGLHQHIERNLAGGGKFAHDRCPQLSSEPWIPAAQAEAGIARLPSGLTSRSSMQPSAAPR